MKYKEGDIILAYSDIDSVYLKVLTLTIENYPVKVNVLKTNSCKMHYEIGDIFTLNQNKNYVKIRKVTRRKELEDIMVELL